MSSKYVRDLVETWLRDPTMGVPYHPTVNQEQDPVDPIWCTAGFDGTFRETTTFCQDGPVEENGEIEVVYFGPAGEGADALLVAIENDMKTLMAQRDAGMKLSLVERSAPYEYSGGSAEQQYSLAIFLDYTYYE